MDIGNTSDSGQFILGEPLNEVNRRSRTRLRTIFELYPESVDASLDDDRLPSCSAAESLERQEPFVNQVLAQHALSLLARLFRYGNISYHGGFINLRGGCGGRLSVDPDVWRRIRRRSGVKATSLDFDLAAVQVAHSIFHTPMPIILHKAYTGRVVESRFYRCTYIKILRNLLFML